MNQDEAENRELADAELDQVAGGRDKGAGDLSEKLQMQLQQAESRSSKFTTTLSNILNSISSTASQITGNLK